MKPNHEDSRLTDHALGECDPITAAEIDRALEAHPSVRAAHAEVCETRDELVAVFGNEKERLLPGQREAIRRAAREASRQGQVEQLPSHRKGGRSWFTPVAAAAVIMGGIFLLTLIPKNGSGKTGKPVANGADQDDTHGRVEAVLRENQPSIRLPLRAAGNSLAQVADAVRADKRAPLPDEVRLPEILNSFPLRAHGAAALYGGCKLAAEILPSPWKPSASLVLVEIQGAKNEMRRVSLEYRPESEVVIRHRVLGYEPAAAESSSQSPSAPRLEADARMLLLIEIESMDLRLGSLDWKVGDSHAPSLPLTRDPSYEPSDDARFAVLIGAFAMWLRGESPELVDSAMVLALAREVAGAGLVADRYDFLTLVDEAVRVGAK